MDELIPHLRDLCFTKNGYDVPVDFAAGFVTLHVEDWRTAQAHWEKIVDLVLGTDAVDRRASGRDAIHQAVRATVILLTRSGLRRRCPFCPASGGASPVGEERQVDDGTSK